MSERSCSCMEIIPTCKLLDQCIFKDTYNCVLVVYALQQVFFIFLCVGLTVLLVLFQSSVGWSRSDQKAENWWRKRKTNVNKKANWKIPHHWMIESRFTQTEELIQKRGCWFFCQDIKLCTYYRGHTQFNGNIITFMLKVVFFSKKF